MYKVGLRVASHLNFTQRKKRFDVFYQENIALFLLIYPAVGTDILWL